MTDTIEDSNSNSDSTDAIAVGKENLVMETDPDTVDSNDANTLAVMSCSGTKQSPADEDAAQSPAEATTTAAAAAAAAAAESNQDQAPSNDSQHTTADEKVGADKIDIHRPVKRARTAYFVFADERRAELQKQHPGEGVAVVARALGQIWSSLSETEKLPYQQIAAKERERVQWQVEAWKAAGGVVGEPQPHASNNNSKNNDPTTTFPVARIRKICKLDPEVKNLSKEALLLVTKAAELALTKLGQECVRTAQIQNRRKLLPDDVAQVCAVREQFAFLREDIVDLHRQQLHEAEQAKADKPPPTHCKKDGAAAASMKNSKPLTDYFKAAAN